MEPPLISVRALGCQPQATTDAPPGSLLTFSPSGCGQPDGPASPSSLGTPRSPSSRWLARWEVRNVGPEPLALEAAWIPHGRFRGDGRLTLSAQIEPDGTAELAFTVTAAEPPGTVVENAFLIVRVRALEAVWRVFVRMRIEFDASAVPWPVVEAITTQLVE